MAARTKFLKFLSVLISAIFLFSNIAWSAPDPKIISSDLLRPLSALDNPVGAEALNALFSDVGTRKARQQELRRLGITEEQISRQLALLNQAAAAEQEVAVESDFERFPEFVPANDEIIRAGKTRNALKKLSIVIAAGGEGSRLLDKLVESGFLTGEEVRKLTKVTIPLTPVKRFSTLHTQLAVISYICKKYKVDIPVCVAISPLEGNGPLIKKFLEENNDFGIKNLFTALQDVNPTYKTGSDEIATKQDGSPAFNPNGVGGILRALVKDGVIEKLRKILGKDGRFFFLNGDNIIDEDLIYTAAGAPVVNPGRPYINFTYKDPSNTRLGIPCIAKSREDGREQAEIVEIRERAKVHGLDEACAEAFAKGELQAQGNIVSLSLEGIEAKIATLTEHALLNKDSHGVTGKVRKVEYFLPDMMALYSGDEILLVTVKQFLGIKDPDVRNEVEAQLVQEGIEKAAEVAIKVEDGGVVEFAPDFDPRAFESRAITVKANEAVYFAKDQIEVYSKEQIAASNMGGAKPAGIIATQARIEAVAAETVDKVFSKLAGPMVLEDIRNARGELVVPGLLTIIDESLEGAGYAKPKGTAHFISGTKASAILANAIKKDPYIAKRTVIHTVRDEGKKKRLRRTEYYNRLYESLIRKQPAQLGRKRMQYLLGNLSENSLGRYLLLYIRGTSPELWQNIVERVNAGEFRISDEARDTWEDVQNTMMDERTKLEIGNPDRNPFGDIEAIDYAELQRQVWQRATSGVFSVSGIRQIFDSLFGDKPLPLRFPWRLGIGTEPTMAAKVHAAKQAQLFAQMLKDPGAFAERIPRVKNQSEGDHQKSKDNFTALMKRTQDAKPKKDRPKVAIFVDTRSTGPSLADVDVRTLIAEGVDVEYAFVGSVCEAAVYTKDNPEIDGAIYISASHNDEGYNGIKLLLGDGRIMPETVAYPYIFALRGDSPKVVEGRAKGVLENGQHTKELIERISSVDPKDVRKVYRRIPTVKKQSQKADWNYRNRVITGAKTNAAAGKQIKQLRDRISKLKLAVITDPNGGAREDAEYLESLGFEVRTINARPRYDMNHELCPSTAPVEETTEELMAIKKELKGQGYTVIGSMHNDTDGDRRNFRPIDPSGNFGLRDDMAQICFALDTISYVLSNYDFKNNRPTKLLGVACNGPTAMLIEDLAETFGFVVIRAQTGEANVVDGMETLAGMTWAEVKEAANAGEHEIIVPESLKGWFDGSHDDEKIDVVIAGEGSNGSDFTSELLVRDPLHTIKSIINFIDPTTGKDFMRAFLARMGKEDEFDESAWETEEGKATMMHKVISYLPVNKTTDFFTIGGEGEKINPPLLVGLVKDNFDKAFSESYESKIKQELAAAWGVSEEDVDAEYVNYEEKAKVGKGNRKTTAPVGRQVGDGGYKVKFYINKDGQRLPLAWEWFRDSITEAGLTRIGTSVVFPSAITGVDPEEQQRMVDATYKLIMNNLKSCLADAVSNTSEQIMKADLKRLPKKLKPYENMLGEAKKSLAEYYRKQMESSASVLDGADEEGKTRQELLESI
ncbi:MAG: hypothetical protein ABH825_02985 [Candidatus Omnitrophota bacterium]